MSTELNCWSVAFIGKVWYDAVIKRKESRRHEGKDAWHDDCIFKKGNRNDTAGACRKMGVTDKAVSKWERDLSCPDVNAIPKLADILGVSVDELMRNRLEPQREEGKGLAPLVHTILKAIALAMGVSVAVLSVLTELDVHFGMSMLGIGLAFLAMTSLEEKGKA